MRRPRIVIVSFLCLVFQTAQSPAIDFVEQTIDPQPGKVGYAVTASDVNEDGMLDAVVVTEDRVLWYEAPDWKSHEMLAGGTRRDNVCIAPADIDQDGQVDFALGAGWPQNGGTISWLSRDPQRGTEGLWKGAFPNCRSQILVIFGIRPLG
jgi:hypothetical protein